MSDTPKFKTFRDLKSISNKIEEKPKLELVGQDTQPTPPTEITNPTQHTQPILQNQPNIPNQPKQRVRKEVSPKGDWGKSPNSIARDIIPERHFKGLSFQTYDALHLRTRRANPPVRRIRATKSDLLRWTGLSDVTLDKHISYLKSKGFIDVEFMRGSHEGNWYEVFTPEELPNLTNPTQDNQANQSKKVGGETPNLVGGVGGVYDVENKDDKHLPKTIDKTINNDDELLRSLNAVSIKLTGRELGKTDLSQFIELICSEIDSAGSKTTVSSVLAFAAEALGRKFRTYKPKKEKDSYRDTIGKSVEVLKIEAYEPEPLTEEGFAATLESFKTFARTNPQSLLAGKSIYTESDWNRLIGALKEWSKTEGKLDLDFPEA